MGKEKSGTSPLGAPEGSPRSLKVVSHCTCCSHCPGMHGPSFLSDNSDLPFIGSDASSSRKPFLPAPCTQAGATALPTLLLLEKSHQVPLTMRLICPVTALRLQPWNQPDLLVDSGSRAPGQPPHEGTSPETGSCPAPIRLKCYLHWMQKDP